MYQQDNSQRSHKNSKHADQLQITKILANVPLSTLELGNRWQKKWDFVIFLLLPYKTLN